MHINNNKIIICLYTVAVFHSRSEQSLRVDDKRMSSCHYNVTETSVIAEITISLRQATKQCTQSVRSCTMPSTLPRPSLNTLPTEHHTPTSLASIFHRLHHHVPSYVGKSGAILLLEELVFLAHPHCPQPQGYRLRLQVHLPLQHVAR